MFNLSEIMQSAQGGQAIPNLAKQFGLTQEQAESAINALLPAFSVGLQNQAQNMGSLSQIIGAMLGGQHATTFDDPNAHLNQQTMSAGNNVLGQLFGPGQATSAIAQQVSRATGINPGILMAMMPVIASMLMSGLFKSASNQGLGGLLGQLASGAFGGAAGTAPAGQAPGQPGGGVLGNILSNVVGNMMHAQPGGTASAPQPGTGSPGMPGMNPAMQAGLDVLTGMFKSGAQAQSAHVSAMQDILNAYMRGASGKTS
ncbi:MAG: DUF937 domain-containing protein [Hyphomicrobiales bacterium]|nr:DUF937 domain-containing protein [Hyphomicrobiales bacterium]MBV8768893.1 DUF937 domain-containing protein [Hyphomicrobiales bacterium]MBV9137377.1 DUF937 domain-containing protein [Hyphomicrobiales bacterium]MBV9977385.1 DUF937 domain-containing protein [Hyphomicrobiales bacterium]